MNSAEPKSLRAEASDWLNSLEELNQPQLTASIKSRFTALTSEFEALVKELRAKSVSVKLKHKERKETLSVWHKSLKNVQSLWSQSLVDMQASLKFQQRTHKNYEAEARRTLKQLTDERPKEEEIRNAIRVLSRARLIVPRKVEDSFESSLNQHQEQPAGEYSIEELLDLSNVETPVKKSTKRAYKFLSNT